VYIDPHSQVEVPDVVNGNDNLEESHDGEMHWMGIGVTGLGSSLDEGIQVPDVVGGIGTRFNFRRSRMDFTQKRKLVHRDSPAHTLFSPPITDWCQGDPSS
jgi:TPP-dependent trihydroxycyclohexane-1,2-dione (THcHDO) dehydratase